MQRMIISLAAIYSCRNGGEEKGKNWEMQKERRGRKDEMMIVIWIKMIQRLMVAMAFFWWPQGRQAASQEEEKKINNLENFRNYSFYSTPIISKRQIVTLIMHV